MTDSCPFHHTNTGPEVIRLAVVPDVRFPLSLHNVEGLLHERGIEFSPETVRYWRTRLRLMFAAHLTASLLRCARRRSPSCPRRTRDSSAVEDALSDAFAAAPRVCCLLACRTCTTLGDGVGDKVRRRLLPSRSALRPNLQQDPIAYGIP